MAKTIVDEILEPYIKRIVDICYTNIEPPHMPCLSWHNKWRVVKWSKLLEWKKYDEIRDRAKRIFEIMEESGAPCPTVTFYDVGGLKMEWTNERRKLLILIAPKKALQYSRGYGSDVMINNPIEEDEKLYGLLPIFANFLYPKCL